MTLWKHQSRVQFSEYRIWKDRLPAVCRTFAQAAPSKGGRAFIAGTGSPETAVVSKLAVSSSELYHGPRDQKGEGCKHCCQAQVFCTSLCQLTTLYSELSENGMPGSQKLRTLGLQQCRAF